MKRKGNGEEDTVPVVLEDEEVGRGMPLEKARTSPEKGVVSQRVLSPRLSYRRSNLISPSRTE